MPPDTWTHVVLPGHTRAGNLYVLIRYNVERLSLSGVVGPLPNGDAIGDCGQIRSELHKLTKLRPGWTLDTVSRLHETWRRWHLNDLRPWCEHQRDTLDHDAELELWGLTWGPKYHAMRERVLIGAMPLDEYAAWAPTVDLVSKLTLGLYTPKHPLAWGEAGERALAEELVKADPRGKEVRLAGQVSPREHPRGVLGVQCQTCGYRYGSGWHVEPVPADVVAFLQNLPPADPPIPTRWTT